MTRVLFICGKNRWRSPTAEHLFAKQHQLECASAGVNHDADTPVTPELLDWAEQIFVMEKQHKAKLAAKFADSLKGKQVISLDIPDRYRFMDPALVALLKRKLERYLPSNAHNH